MSKDQNPTLNRRQQELQLVEARGQVSVEELARYFDVSDDTIRRDLQELERRKLLLRTHGGAVSAASLVHRATPFLTRASVNAEAKARIGRAAAQLIADGEALIINGGSTTFAFAAGLSLRRDLTIVTNNVTMLSVLPVEAVDSVYVLGGEFNRNLGSTVGAVGFASGNITVDTAVLGITGLSAAAGLSTTLLEEAPMMASMITSARRTIVLADSSKFGFNAFAQVAPLNAVDILVTDADPPEDLCQALIQANVEIIVATPNSNQPRMDDERE